MASSLPCQTTATTDYDDLTTQFEPLEWSLQKDFECPVTREIMSQPVVAGDGHTYDRESIEYWLATHSTSPVTNVEMITSTVVPNHTLHTLIDHHRQRLGRKLLLSAAQITTSNAEYLLEQGGNMNIRTPSGDTLLMVAVRTKRYDLVRLLLERGVVLISGNNDLGEDVLSLARSLPVVDAQQMVQLLAPAVEKALSAQVEAQQMQAAQDESTGGAAPLEEDHRGLLPGFPLAVDGWTMNAENGYFPSVFALLFHRFMRPRQELPTAREAYMHSTLSKFAMGSMMVALVMVLFL